MTSAVVAAAATRSMSESANENSGSVSQGAKHASSGGAHSGLPRGQPSVRLVPSRPPFLLQEVPVPRAASPGAGAGTGDLPPGGGGGIRPSSSRGTPDDTASAGRSRPMTRAPPAPPVATPGQVESGASTQPSQPRNRATDRQRSSVALSAHSATSRLHAAPKPVGPEEGPPAKARRRATRRRPSRSLSAASERQSTATLASSGATRQASTESLAAAGHATNVQHNPKAPSA